MVLVHYISLMEYVQVLVIMVFEGVIYLNFFIAAGVDSYLDLRVLLVIYFPKHVKEVY